MGDGDKTSSYYYNSLTSSGAYTNAVEGFNSYFTDENPRHCGASLATWGEANAITRFTLDGVAFVQDVETGEDDTEILLSTWTAENDVAKVVIDTATGAITVTPKAVGETKLVGTVGAGADGTLPNGKDDELIITVKEDEVLGDEEEPKEDPKEDPKDDEVLGDEENPGTGDAVLLSVLALAGSAALAGASFKKFRK